MGKPDKIGWTFRTGDSWKQVYKLIRNKKMNFTKGRSRC